MSPAGSVALTVTALIEIPQECLIGSDQRGVC
jgi:hypothetical protein